ncbi:excinuclease ABC subunit A [Tropicimonas sp. S265A]|uniref:excinuclease ABC subunit A n=1 Tax=Tropicimonas sp. S265A TaxID=3415134 RepID=UPI003C7E58F1
MTKYLALFLTILAAAGSPVLAKGPNHCPPGLAKKSPACIPPGQVGKGTVLRPGTYDLLDRPWRFGLERGKSYARFGDIIVEINKDTREVLDLIGAVDAILN